MRAPLVLLHAPPVVFMRVDAPMYICARLHMPTSALCMSLHLCMCMLPMQAIVCKHVCVHACVHAGAPQWGGGSSLHAPAHLYTPLPPPPPSQLATQFKALQALALGLDLAPFIVPPSARQATSHAVAHAVRAASGAAGGGKHSHNHHNHNNHHHNHQLGHNCAHHAVLHPPSQPPSSELPCPPLGSSHQQQQQQQQQPPLVPMPPPPQPPLRHASTHPVSSSHAPQLAYTSGSTKRAFSSTLPSGPVSSHTAAAAAGASEQASCWVDDSVQGMPVLHVLSGAPKRRRSVASKRARCADQVNMHAALLLHPVSSLPPAPPPPSWQQPRQQQQEQPDMPHHDNFEGLAAAAAAAAASAIASPPLAPAPPAPTALTPTPPAPSLAPMSTSQPPLRQNHSNLHNREGPVAMCGGTHPLQSPPQPPLPPCPPSAPLPGAPQTQGTPEGQVQALHPPPLPPPPQAPPHQQQHLVACVHPSYPCDQLARPCQGKGGPVLSSKADHRHQSSKEGEQQRPQSSKEGVGAAGPPKPPMFVVHPSQTNSSPRSSTSSQHAYSPVREGGGAGGSDGEELLSVREEEEEVRGTVGPQPPPAPAPSGSVPSAHPSLSLQQQQQQLLAVEHKGGGSSRAVTCASPSSPHASIGEHVVC
ncbi:hypothetical protein DUNSADRAFT_6238 [Dunaliella salina]|uniref:SWIM-type domain-containing protein n=1 Tax=Dunaliella salina TaxID=3046 RepID=A0ABQ7GNQ6_DUNSA|nr:hypothetical protein DUNSADRAFT_6238 [Dunaliella salina]|eukprot:KAF5836226.1 hypothetical protein DUNSADRAFT_6238 [Dunaliella salina]